MTESCEVAENVDKVLIMIAQCFLKTDKEKVVKLYKMLIYKMLIRMFSED